MSVGRGRGGEGAPAAGPKGGAHPRRRVLIVDDDPQARRALARFVMDRGFESLTAEDGPAALALLATTSADMMLVDVAMPAMSGAEVVARAKRSRPDLEIVVMAGVGDLGGVPEAIAAGAFGFVNKPPALDEEVTLAITRAIEKGDLVRRARALEERLAEHERFGEIIGQSARLREAHRVATAAGTTSAPVLILGESGTGKELFARLIHRHGSRAMSAFTMIDCGAISPELVEAELASVVTGARRAIGEAGATRAIGAVSEAASDGTVFLDAVSELSPSAQARLVEALGQSKPGGARVIAAAPPDLRDRVAAGLFREDLFYRLSVILIELPPLRQRKEDIPLLAYWFLNRHARRAGRDIKKINAEALKSLRDRAWPGNVRELGNAIERAVALSRGDVIGPSDLPSPSGATAGGAGARSSFGGIGGAGGLGARAVMNDDALGELPYPEARDRVVDAFERGYVESVMEGASGNLSEAARRAGMDRSNFRRLVRKVRKVDEGPEAKQTRKA